MSEYRFSLVQRFALWKAYDGHCFYCECPVSFQEVTIDHILPESLLADPKKLSDLIEEYGIDQIAPSFSINSPANWVPAHNRTCNMKKGQLVLPRKGVLLFLKEVQRRVPAVQKALAAVSSQKKQSNLLGEIAGAVNNDPELLADYREFLDLVEGELHQDEPLVFGFWASDEAIEEHAVIPHQQIAVHPRMDVYDWAQLDLVSHLRSILSTPFHYTQPVDTSGGGIGLRIVFPNLIQAEFSNRFDRPWWDIAEVANYWEVYESSYAEDCPQPPSREYYGEIGEFDPLPLPLAGDGAGSAGCAD